MSQKTNADHSKEAQAETYPGYPKYPAKEDIYKQDKESEYIDDESLKSEENRDGSPTEDSDAPGSGLDDANEEIGEENNYYSRENEDDN